jgi:hypothetical protein
MEARISSLAIAAALAAPISLAQVSMASSATAQFFVTGYVLRGYTATGTYVHPGTCAVDPLVIPLEATLQSLALAPAMPRTAVGPSSATASTCGWRRWRRRTRSPVGTPPRGARLRRSSCPVQRSCAW